MKRDLLKCMAVAVVFGMVKTLSSLMNELLFTVSESGGLDSSYLILSLGLGAPAFSTTALLQLTLDILPLFFFQFLFGVRIYRHFCTAGVYFFTRQPRRATWFLRETRELIVLSLCYPLFMMAAAACSAALYCRVWFDAASGFLLLSYWAITAFWLFLTTMLINLVALKLGSNQSFLIVGGVQIACISVLMVLERFFSSENLAAVRQGRMLLRLNPIAHLVLSWHSSFFPAAGDKIRLFWQDVAFSEPISTEVDLWASAVLFLLLSGMLVVIGVWLIDRQEFIVNDLEEGE